MSETTLTAADRYWFVTRIEEDDANVCIEHEHWDVWYEGGTMRTVVSEPGRYDGVFESRPCNVMCILGDEADVRRLVELHNATLPSSPSGSAPLPSTPTPPAEQEP